MATIRHKVGHLGTLQETERNVRLRCSFDRYLGSGAHLVKRWSALASRWEPADQA
jgi:hypothetical protein